MHEDGVAKKKKALKSEKKRNDDDNDDGGDERKNDDDNNNNNNDNNSKNDNFTNDDLNENELVTDAELDDNAREQRNAELLKPLYPAIKPIEMVCEFVASARSCRRRLCGPRARIALACTRMHARTRSLIVAFVAILIARVCMLLRP